MTNEETPLLVNDHGLVFDRFTPRKKKVLVIIVSWVGFLAFLTSGIFLPSIPQMARDLESTGAVISNAISTYFIGSAFGGLLGSRYSKFYGRRPAFLFHLPLMVIGSLMTGRAETVLQLMIGRTIQAVGASPGLSVGAGVIGDIYRLEERGTALGSYFGTGLFGLALAPTVGGVVAHYSSWRAVHYGLAGLGCIALVCILLFLPETSHPGSRGVDEYEKAGKPLPKWRPVILNPFSQLLMLRSPNILSTTLVGCFAILTDLSLMVPITFTIGKAYNIDNEATIGLLFLPIGFGNALGAPLSGWISDRIVVQCKTKRGYWYPEDRLRACLYGIYLPLTVIGSALATAYVPGTPGLVLNLIIFFWNGVGTDLALTPCGAYVVDVMHSNSAEVTAAANGFRSVVLSICTSALLPMINAYGQVFTNGCVALVSSLGIILTILVIAYGDAMRSWVDIGYSTGGNN